MLLIALVVRSTTQKDKAFPKTQGETYASTNYAPLGDEFTVCVLHGTDKMITVTIEGIVAHGPGGNERDVLVF
jgi:hypothetical protein